jgi:hypothetical protein
VEQHHRPAESLSLVVEADTVDYDKLANLAVKCRIYKPVVCVDGNTITPILSPFLPFDAAPKDLAQTLHENLMKRSLKSDGSAPDFQLNGKLTRVTTL